MSSRTLGVVLFLISFPIPTLADEAPAKEKAPEAAKVVPPYPTASNEPLEAKESVVKEADQHTQLRVEFKGIKGDRVPLFCTFPNARTRSRCRPFCCNTASAATKPPATSSAWASNSSNAASWS